MLFPGMARRPLSRKPVVQVRSVLVELPEDKLLALQKKAKESGVSVHGLAARVLSDWLAP